jgi:hypothetical protein
MALSTNSATLLTMGVKVSLKSKSTVSPFWYESKIGLMVFNPEINHISKTLPRIKLKLVKKHS